MKNVFYLFIILFLFEFSKNGKTSNNVNNEVMSLESDESDVVKNNLS